MIFHSRCLTPANIDDVKSSILSDKNPECVKCGGLVKPDIVFFGEMLPDRFWSLQVNISISKAHFISDSRKPIWPFLFPFNFCYWLKRIFFLFSFYFIQMIFIFPKFLSLQFNISFFMFHVHLFILLWVFKSLYNFCFLVQ